MGCERSQKFPPFRASEFFEIVIRRYFQPFTYRRRRTEVGEEVGPRVNRFATKLVIRVVAQSWKYRETMPGSSTVPFQPFKLRLILVRAIWPGSSAVEDTSGKGEEEESPGKRQAFPVEPSFWLAAGGSSENRLGSAV